MVRPIVSDEVVIPRLIIPKTEASLLRQSHRRALCSLGVLTLYRLYRLYMGGQTVEMCGFWVM
jgi:hypothetical protein